MKPNTIQNIFKLFLLTILISSCVNDKKYTDSNTNIQTYDLTANKTVSSFTTAITTSSPTLYVNDDIIEAYVTSSDETGNFFNTICFQTIPTDGSNPIGFSVSVDLKSFAQGFVPGRKVYIKLKGLYTALIDGSVKIGALYEGGLGRISIFDWNKYLFPSAIVVPEEAMIRTLTLSQAAANGNLNTLIDLSNVQFADGSLARTLFDVDSGGRATNHNIVDVNGGTTRFLRVSQFSLFRAENIPAGRGKIRGIMSKFGTDFQFLIRYTNDLRLNAPRTYNFSATLNEGFQTAVVNQKAFTNYLNFSTEGTKDWLVKSGNFLEMSAFSGTVERNKSYFVVPVDFTAANTFSFQIKIQFFNGNALKVYRTTNYVPGMKIEDATLFDITTSFNIPTATTSVFATAGTYNIPTAVQGNGFFVFEYTGTNITTGPALTTTVQLDNILIN